MKKLPSEFRFEFDGKGTICGQRLEAYKVFRRRGDAFVYEQTFCVPEKTPAGDLERCYAEWLDEEEQS